MPKRVDPPPGRIRRKRLHESWCAVVRFFFAESSDPTTHENMQDTHTNAWLSHSEVSQSLIGRLPSTPPLQISSMCSENIQNVGQHSQNVCRILLGDPSEGAPRTFSSFFVQCKAPACLEVFSYSSRCRFGACGMAMQQVSKRYAYSNERVITLPTETRNDE
jgi:hypothetical protein